jgi:hypothetical protein
MLVSFDTLPVTARIWIYQSARQLTDAQATYSKKAVEDFIGNWTAHDAGLKGGVDIKYNQFIIIGVDENYNDASGCSIDKKVNFMKQLGKELDTDFFNRMLIAYKVGDDVKLESMHVLADKIKNGLLDGETMMFNNLVTTKGELMENWNVPVKQSWMKQLIAS